MRNEMPTLGHSSQRAAIRALAADGLSPNRIAEAVGADSKRVREVLEYVPAPADKPKPKYIPGKPHRAAVDPSRIVHGVLSPKVRASREVRPATADAWGRTARALSVPRFQLKRADGLYLRMDAGGFVPDARNGWIGFQDQLDKLQALRPDLAGLTIIRVPPPPRGERAGVRQI